MKNCDLKGLQMCVKGVPTGRFLCIGISILLGIPQLSTALNL